MTIVFRSSTDSGLKGDSSSIRPIQNGELISETVLQRPDNNLRVRTDELSRAVGSLEFLLQTVTSSTILLRYISNSSLVRPGLLSIYYKDFNGSKVYYISPEVPASDSTNGSSPSLVVFGSSTNTFNYILNKLAFTSYYNQGDASNIIEEHNRVLGLSKVGDALCLRIPTVPTTYVGETFLPSSTSKALPAGEATISSTLLESLTTDAIAASDALYSLIKIPAKNSISIVISSGPLYEFLKEAMNLIGDASLDTKVLQVQGMDDSGITNKYVLDLEGLTAEDNMYTLPRSGYRDFEELYSRDIQVFAFFTNNSNAVAQELPASQVMINEETLLPPNEFLFPIAIHTEDSVRIPNFGSASTVDIETREGLALLDSRGVILGETGTATRVFHTRTRISYEALSNQVSSGGVKDYVVKQDTGLEYFRLPIDAYIPEAGEDTHIYLSSLEIHLVLDEAHAGAASSINQQEVRDVYVSIGLFNLSSIPSQLTSSNNVKLSLLTCVPGNSEFDPDNALPNLILSNFRLKDLKDDYIANIELPDSVRNTNALGKSIVVWIYRETEKDNFFTTADAGSIDIDLRMEWSTRLGDTVNLASSISMDRLNT